MTQDEKAIWVATYAAAFAKGCGASVQSLPEAQRQRYLAQAHDTASAIASDAVDQVRKAVNGEPGSIAEYPGTRVPCAIEVWP